MIFDMLKYMKMGIKQAKKSFPNNVYTINELLENGYRVYECFNNNRKKLLVLSNVHITNESVKGLKSSIKGDAGLFNRASLVKKPVTNNYIPALTLDGIYLFRAGTTAVHFDYIGMNDKDICVFYANTVVRYSQD